MPGDFNNAGDVNNTNLDPCRTAAAHRSLALI
jgi:hypothetical protein